MRRFVLIGAGVLMVCGCGAAMGQATASAPATMKSVKGKFTIGKETTVVDGPLNGDGTVDYVGVINGILGKGVTADNNGAIPFLQATMDTFNEKSVAAILKELGAKPGDLAVRLSSYELYAQGKTGHLPTEEDQKGIDAVKLKPWRRADFPMMAAWIGDSQAAVALVEQACERPRFYIPLVREGAPKGFSWQVPPLVMMRVASELLESRAMMEAGAGDWKAAYLDLHRVRIVARFAVEEKLAISHLVGINIERESLKCFESVATSGSLTAEQLKQLRQELEVLPAPPSIDQTFPVETLLSLEDVMQFIRGGGAEYLRAHLLIMDDGKPFAEGDFEQADWDAMMKEMHRNSLRGGEIAKKPLDERLRLLDEAEKAEVSKGFPPEFVGVEDDAAKDQKAIEDYLKMRAGESREAFGVRLADWLEQEDLGYLRRFYLLEERGKMERELALLAVSLAEYQLAHGEYPEGLKDLGAVPLDTLSGKEMRYRREGTGYVMWSVGLNQVDDDGGKDDVVVRAEK